MSLGICATREDATISLVDRGLAATMNVPLDAFSKVNYQLQLSLKSDRTVDFSAAAMPGLLVWAYLVKVLSVRSVSSVMMDCGRDARE